MQVTNSRVGEARLLRLLIPTLLLPSLSNSFPPPLPGSTRLGQTATVGNIRALVPGRLPVERPGPTGSQMSGQVREQQLPAVAGS